MVAAMAIAAAPVTTTLGNAGPTKILVLSQPYGFSHTDSIVAGAAWFLALEAAAPDKYDVTIAVDGTAVAGREIAGLEDDGLDAWEWLRPERLNQFDLLVWNNSTGEVPFPEEERDELRQGVVDFVRSHGIVGVHSAADSNYTWPAFHELIGGQYDGHWYRFGGLTPEPYRMALTVEDPTTPLLAGVSPTMDSYDETYRWQLDVRPDVHVIHSMANASIGAQGALYHYAQPITWCREVGNGHSFYTNLGHDGQLWQDADYTQLIRNAVDWASHRSAEAVDCTVPADPMSGVRASDRVNVSFAELEGTRLELSSYSGGLAAATDIVPGSTITFHGVDLDGVTGIDLFAAAQTLHAPSTTGVTGGPQAGRTTPASGGTVEVHLDSADGPVIASAELLPAPGLVPHTALPGEIAPADGAPAAASWSVLASEVAPTTGTHDLVLTFAPGATSGLAGGVDPTWSAFGSLAWINLR